MRIPSIHRLGFLACVASLLTLGEAGCSDRAEDCAVLLHCGESSGAGAGGVAEASGPSSAGTASAAGAASTGGMPGAVSNTDAGLSAAGTSSESRAGAPSDDAEANLSAGSGGTDGEDDDADDELGGSGGDGGAADDLPCDAGAAPSTTPCAVDEAYAVFVAPTGSDSASGTRHAPLLTLAKALELADVNGKNIIACNGVYDTPLSIRAGVKIYGGFECPGTMSAWSYVEGSVARVTPSAKGVALTINAVKAPVVIEDFEFRSIDASTAGESSVAAYVGSSSNVVLRRVRLLAGAGKAAADAKNTGYTFPALADLQGNSGGEVGGAAKHCQCPDGTATTGGPAGSPPEQNGGPGMPEASTPGGEGGDATLSCSKGGGGADGVAGVAAGDAPGATLLGTLMTSGWMPAAGSAGRAGSPGQGGGGGAGKPAGGGGGGGCGGCGGQGGPGGKGGGSSIALITYESPVVLEASQLVAAAAGNGGRGAPGQAGQTIFGGGGDGAGQGDAGCDGGNGGPGGKGGAGGGGAGGVSVGVLYKGAGPSISATTTVTTGKSGAGGLGGNPGKNDGLDGVAQPTLQVP